MSRTSVFDYITSRSTVNHQQLMTLVEFLVRNQDVILDSGDTLNIFKARPLVASPISKLFQNVESAGLSNLFTIVQIPTKRTYPEVVAMRHLPFDMAQVVMSNPLTKTLLQTAPTLNNKIVINATQMMRATGGLADISGFQSTVVRDLLSRNFAKSGRPTWLTPNLTQFVSKVYSMSLGSAVAQWFRLTFNDQNTLTALFAFFILGAMTTPQNAEGVLKSKGKFFRISGTQEIEQLIDHVEHTLGKRSLDSLEDVFEVINSLGVERLKLDRAFFMSRLRSLGPDTYTTCLALEYPPYFVFLILLALGGAKIGLSYRMKEQGLIRDPEALRFAESLISSTDLFDLQAL